MGSTEDISEAVRQILGAEGIQIRLNAKCISLAKRDSRIAVGHPFAATGARIVGTLAKLLHKSGKQRGLISICTAGGMGVAAILESV